MYKVSSVGNRFAGGVSAFAISFFLIAASFAPQGAFVAGFVA